MDADVLVAGCASVEGASHLLLQLGELGLLDVIGSAQVREEAERALARKLPSALPALPAFRQLADAAVRWLPNPPADSLSEHADQAHGEDVAILVAAIDAEADVLLTFNTRHHRARSAPPRIERPGAFLQRLRARLQDLVDPRALTESD